MSFSGIVHKKNDFGKESQDLLSLKPGGAGRVTRLTEEFKPVVPINPLTNELSQNVLDQTRDVAFHSLEVLQEGFCNLSLGCSKEQRFIPNFEPIVQQELPSFSFLNSMGMVSCVEEIKRLLYINRKTLDSATEDMVVSKLRELYQKKLISAKDIMRLVNCWYEDMRIASPKYIFLTPKILCLAFQFSSGLDQYLRLLDINNNLKLLSHITILATTRSIFSNMNWTGKDIIKLLNLVGNRKIVIQGVNIYFTPPMYTDAIRNAQSVFELKTMLNLMAKRGFVFHKFSFLIKNIFIALNSFRWDGYEVLSLLKLAADNQIAFQGILVKFDAFMYKTAIKNISNLDQFKQFWALVNQQDFMFFEDSNLILCMGDCLGSGRWSGNDAVELIKLEFNRQLCFFGKPVAFDIVPYMQALKCAQTVEHVLTMLEFISRRGFSSHNDLFLIKAIGKALSNATWDGREVIRLLKLQTENKLLIRGQTVIFDFDMYALSLVNVRSVDQVQEILSMLNHKDRSGCFSESYTKHLMVSIGKSICNSNWSSEEVIKLLFLDSQKKVICSGDVLQFTSFLYRQSVKKCQNLDQFLRVLYLSNCRKLLSCNDFYMMASLGQALNSLTWPSQDVLQLLRLAHRGEIRCFDGPVVLDPSIYVQAIKNADNLHQLLEILSYSESCKFLSFQDQLMMVSIGEVLTRIHWSGQDVVELFRLESLGQLFFHGKPIQFDIWTCVEVLRNVQTVNQLQTVLDLMYHKNFSSSQDSILIDAIRFSLESSRWSTSEVLNLLEYDAYKKLYIGKRPFFLDFDIYLILLSYAGCVDEVSKILNVIDNKFFISNRISLLNNSIARSFDRVAWDGEEVVKFLNLGVDGYWTIQDSVIEFDLSVFIKAIEKIQNVDQLHRVLAMMEKKFSTTLYRLEVTNSLMSGLCALNWSGDDALKLLNLVSQGELLVCEEPVLFDLGMYLQAFRCFQTAKQFESFLKLLNGLSMFSFQNEDILDIVRFSLGKMRCVGMESFQLLVLEFDKKLCVGGNPVFFDPSIFELILKSLRNRKEIFSLYEMFKIRFQDITLRVSFLNFSYKFFGQDEFLRSVIVQLVKSDFLFYSRPRAYYLDLDGFCSDLALEILQCVLTQVSKESDINFLEIHFGHLFYGCIDSMLKENALFYLCLFPRTLEVSDSGESVLLKLFDCANVPR